MPTQVLTTLGFLATGAPQQELANRSAMCQSALSRGMPAVWDGIIQMSSREIKRPHNVVEQIPIKAQFAARAGFRQCTILHVTRKCSEPAPWLVRLLRLVQRTIHLFSLSMVANRLEAAVVFQGWFLGESSLFVAFCYLCLLIGS